MSYSNLSNKELQQLQNNYRKGIIDVKKIPKDQLMDLKELYKKQIEWLEKSIELDKQKIVIIRKKISNN